MWKPLGLRCPLACCPSQLLMGMPQMRVVMGQEWRLSPKSHLQPRKRSQGLSCPLAMMTEWLSGLRQVGDVVCDPKESRLQHGLQPHAVMAHALLRQLGQRRVGRCLHLTQACPFLQTS